MFLKKRADAQNAYINYIKRQAPILFFQLDNLGRIQETNHYTRSIIGEIPPNLPFESLIVQLNDTFDLTLIKEVSQPQLFSIQTDLSPYPQSYLFTFTSFKNETLVFGHMDGDEATLMQNELINLNQTLNNTSRELHKKNAQLQAALKEIKTLRGIIPICSHCHQIRDDQAVWNQLEKYISEHTDAQFSHGICPNCLKKHYPDLMDDM